MKSKRMSFTASCVGIEGGGTNVGFFAEDGGRRPVKSGLPEINRLVIGISLEEQPQMVGGVGLQFLRLLPRDQRDVRILFPEYLGDSRLHRADELAVVPLLKHPWQTVRFRTRYGV